MLLAIIPKLYTRRGKVLLTFWKFYLADFFVYIWVWDLFLFKYTSKAVMLLFGTHKFACFQLLSVENFNSLSVYTWISLWLMLHHYCISATSFATVVRASRTMDDKLGISEKLIHGALCCRWQHLSAGVLRVFRNLGLALFPQGTNIEAIGAMEWTILEQNGPIYSSFVSVHIRGFGVTR